MDAGQIRVIVMIKTQGIIHARPRLVIVCLLLISLLFSQTLPAAASYDGSDSLSCVCVGADGKKYQIMAFYGEDAGIPGNAAISASAITEDDADYELYASQAVNTLGYSAGGENSVRLFDISVVDGNDASVVYQPAGGATVEIKVRLASAPENEMGVVHFGDRPEVLASAVTGRTVSFETTGFSVYAFVDAKSVDTDSSGVFGGEVADLDGETLFISNKRNSTEYYLLGAAAATNWLAQTSSRNNAQGFTFHKQEGSDDLYAVSFTTEGGEEKYLKLTTSAMLISDDPYYFKITKHSSGVWLFQMGDGSNNYMNHNDASGFTRWSNGYNDAGNRIILTRLPEDIPDDPFGLNGSSYGIGKVLSDESGSLSGVALSNELNSNNRLGADVMAQLSMSAGSMGEMFQTVTDITSWTFRCVSGNSYYLTSALDGRQVFLNINGSAVTVTDTPDANSVITVLSGTGQYAGKIRLCNSSGQAVNLYSGRASNGFGGYNDSGPNEWFNLIEKLPIENEDIVIHSATKVSVSDTVNVPNGSQIILYTRIWNETTKRYEFYAADYDGRMVPLYEDGGQVKWVGTQINTLLWNFTEYYYAGTTTPNYYYELQNEYSGLYLAPQNSIGQMLSDDIIGINMNGRRYGEYYTEILAWDDHHYDYSGIRVEDGRLVTCPMSRSEDFYFAVLNPDQTEDGLTTVETVDNDDHGIRMKMFDYNGTKTGSNQYDQVQTDVLGYRTNDTGIAAAYLNEDGYPTSTVSGTSIGEMFTANGTTILGGETANHMFLASTYNESGYFEYNSTKNFAHLNDDGNFTVYNQVGTIDATSTSRDHGQFMPYNDLTEGYFSSVYTNQTDELDQPLSAGDPSLGQALYAINLNDANFHFGMELEASFMQSPDGLDAWGHDLIFEFAGDDDMWLYVDGMLVLDLGGVHPADVGKVNFRTGEVTTTRVQGQSATGAKVTVNTNLRELFEAGYRAQNTEATDDEVAEWLDGIFEEGTNTFRNYSSHTMKMLYMERGAGASNLHMRFNLTSTSDGQVLLKKAVTGTDKQDYSSSRFPYQIFYYDRDYLDYRMVTRSESVVDGETVYTYSGVSQVNYENTTQPVEYADSYNGYANVFFLKPGQAAEIMFPNESTEYYIRECGVDEQIYDAVSVNGEELTAVTNGSVYDFESPSMTVGERKVVGFENHANPEGLRTLTVTKWLYDEQNNRLSYEDDPTGFRFRVYVGDELDYYRMDSYYVKDANGEYCRFDPDTQSFVSVGVSVFDDLTEEQLDDCTFTTSPSGAIDKIPADHTFEIRNLLVGTKFRIIERASDIPYGYDWIEYERDDGSYIVESGEALNEGTIRDKSNPHLIVKNKRGWGLTVNKVWSDEHITTSHDNIYIGVFCNDALVPGTLRVLRTEVNESNPTAETSHYYFFKELIDGAVFSDYTTKEVALTDPVVDEDGFVTSYGEMTVIGGETKLSAGAVSAETGAYDEFSYSAVYSVGEPTGAVGNVRSDTVTNIRPGVRIVKTDENGDPLKGSVFTIKDASGADIGPETYKTDAEGLVSYVYPADGETLTLTETSATKGYASLIDSVTLTLEGDTVTVGGDANGDVTVSGKDETGTVTVSVRNRKMLFSVLKTNYNDGRPLEGVHFALYRQVMSVNGLRKDYFPMSGYDDLVTGADGLIPGIDQTLTNGIYYLTETEALPGYLKSEEDVEFSIDAKGAVTLIEGPEGCLTSEVDESGRTVCLMTLTNRKSLRSLNLTPQTLVADFGLDISYNVTDNNLLVPANSSYTYIGIAPAGTYDSIGSEEAPQNMLAGVDEPLVTEFGTLTLSADGSTKYSIGTMSFTGEDSFCLVAHVTMVNGLSSDVYAYEKLTYIPATTVYYEDDFVSDENYHDGVENTETGHNFGKWSKVTSGEAQTEQAADLAASESANIFGFDPAYTDFATYSNNGAHTVSVSTVNSGNGNKNWPYAEFDFAGTGFDLISVTGCDTGMFAVTVYETQTDGDGNVTVGDVAAKRTIDTYYGCSYGQMYLDESGSVTLENTGKPLYRATDEIIEAADPKNLLMTNGKYLTPDVTYVDSDGSLTTETRYYDGSGKAVAEAYYKNASTGEVVSEIPSGQEADYQPNYARAYSEGWVVDPSSEESLYQIPVVKITDLPYGTYRAHIEPRFAKFYNHWETVDGYDYYDLYVDAFRVYDPAGRSEDATLSSEVIQEAYDYSYEAYERFTTLKKVVVGAESLGTISTGTKAVTEGAVVVDGKVILDSSSLEEYKTFGPVNELYLGKDMSVAFELYSTDVPNDLQIQLKKISSALPTLSVTYVDPEGTVFSGQLAVSSASDLSYSVLKLIGENNMSWTKQSNGYQSSGLLIITNSGEDESVLSVTNLKWTFSNEGSIKYANETDAVTVAPKSASNLKTAMSFARLNPTVSGAEARDVVCEDGQVIMTVTTGTDVQSLVIRDTDGNVIDSSLITAAFEDLDSGERQWTVTVEESESGDYVFSVQAQSDGLNSGDALKIAVTVDADASASDSGSGSGSVVKEILSFFETLRSVINRIIGMIKEKLSYLGIILE